MKQALSIRLAATCLAVLLPVTIDCTLLGQAHSKSKDVVIVPPSQLPEQARLPGESCFLHSDSAGATYLYIEEQMGTRLLILDVSDPAKIKLHAVAHLDAPGPFEPVRSIDSRSELIRFLNGQGTGILDLHKPKTPTVRKISNLADTNRTESLGASALLISTEKVKQVHAVPRDFLVLDTSATADPALLATIRQVSSEAVNPETGTMFLLGSDGLTVIRHLSAENDSKVLHAMQ